MQEITLAKTKRKILISYFPTDFLDFSSHPGMLYKSIYDISETCLDDTSAIKSAAAKEKLVGHCEVCVYATDATYGDKALGFALFGFPIGKLGVDNQTIRATGKGCLEAIAVAPECQNEGVGMALLEYVIEYAKSYECPAIEALAVVWKEKPLFNERLLESAGFSKIRRIENAFTEDSLTNGWTCKECGGVCHHSADLYELRLTKAKEAENREDLPGSESHPLEPRKTEDKSIRELMAKAHKTAVDHGWWEDGGKKNFGELMMLVVSEASEAFECFRNGDGIDQEFLSRDSEGGYGKPEGIPSELADVVIRVMDLCAFYKIDLQAAIETKMAYNETRPYRHGGKKC